MQPTALIVGGSSGLGLELARLLAETHKVFVTGRKDPGEERVQFFEFDLENQFLSNAVTLFLAGLPKIGLFVYAAGFYQEGKLDELTPAQIGKMVKIGITAPTFFLRAILKAQDRLPGFIAITSTSQWTPRLDEPVYTAAKAGLGMLANSASLDKRIGKVLVVGPAGMNTAFWRNSPRDPSVMLDPKWVAEQIMLLWIKTRDYRFAHILRQPNRVEVKEDR